MFLTSNIFSSSIHSLEGNKAYVTFITVAIYILSCLSHFPNTPTVCVVLIQVDSSFLLFIYLQRQFFFSFTLYFLSSEKKYIPMAMAIKEESYAQNSVKKIIFTVRFHNYQNQAAVDLEWIIFVSKRRERR